MRRFSDIRRALSLEEYLWSPLGTLYFNPGAKRASRLIIRHFDRDLPVALVGPFVDFIQEAQSWIEQHPGLEKLVRVEQPVEVGGDFIARRHHAYHTDISHYTGFEDAPEAPEELDQMREAFRTAMGEAKSPRETLIATVLARSLLEANGKTYFDNDEGRFIVVEPKPTPEDIQRWARL
jgi:hypothetical protein